jgi:inosine/xanthosine triphosphate pyrophosphatase family protein
MHHTKNKTNDQVLSNTYSKLLNKIKQRQCRFIGHVIRGEGMENLVATGKIQGKRDRGGQKDRCTTACVNASCKSLQRYSKGL